jgi:hypothetical protein
LKDEFDNRIDENFSEYEENIRTNDFEILVDTENPYSKKINIIENENGSFELLETSKYIK